jgi:hypothetical protein
VFALAAFAFIYDSDVGRILCALLALALIGAVAPRSLWPGWIVVVASAPALLVGFGAAVLLRLLPALIAGFVAFIFARTLVRGREPLIARAIAVLDGAHQLEDSRIAGYARRLTGIWAVYQTLLAVSGMAIALHAQGWFPGAPAWMPTPRVFGAAILPGAVAALFAGEFLLRPRLLPQAPRHGFVAFARALVQAWPKLLEDGRS